MIDVFTCSESFLTQEDYENELIILEKRSVLEKVEEIRTK